MIHHVFANKSNIGDWLSAQGIQRLLGDVAVKEHFCDDPFVEETLEALSQCGPDDLVVIGGGGLFMDYFVPFWEGFYRIADRLRFCIWGVGYCDLKSGQTQPPLGLLHQVIAKSQLSIVRDHLTRSHLAQYQLPEPVVCPSFAAIGPHQPPSRAILHVDNYTTVGAAAYEAMDAAAIQFAQSTQRSYLSTNNRVRPGSIRELQAILGRYAQAEIVLSSALHGCILGVALGRKVVAVSGDYKIDSFMQAAGLGRWVLDPQQVHLVPERLHDAADSDFPNGFAKEAIDRNRRVAEQVLALAN